MRFRNYFSLSGSFSRTELLAATAGLYMVVLLLGTLRQAFPDVISETGYTCLIFSLYPIWGIALGKRSRDLGTTFTYGMLIGMIFPIMGLIFLFQPGEKFRTIKSNDQRRKVAPPPLPVKSPRAS